MKAGRMREMIFLQLQQYNTTKRMLEEYEVVSLRARPSEALSGKGRHGGPDRRRRDQAARTRRRYPPHAGWVWAIEQAWDMLKRDAPLNGAADEDAFSLGEEEKAGARRQPPGGIHGLRCISASPRCTAGARTSYTP